MSKSIPEAFQQASDDYIESFLARFDEKVDVSVGNCWEWTATTGGGYGRVRFGGRDGERFSAHRVAHYLANHDDRISDYWVLHSCHNKLCVNPEHLRLGTAKENTADMFEAGRENQPTSVDCNLGKLTDSEAEEIISRYNTENITQKELAQEYDTCQSNVSKIVNNVSRVNINGTN